MRLDNGMGAVGRSVLVPLFVNNGGGFAGSLQNWWRPGHRRAQIWVTLGGFDVAVSEAIHTIAVRDVQDAHGMAAGAGLANVPAQRERCV